MIATNIQNVEKGLRMHRRCRGCAAFGGIPLPVDGRWGERGWTGQWRLTWIIRHPNHRHHWRSIAVPSADAHIAEEYTDRRAKLRMREYVDQRIQSDDGLGEKCWDGDSQGRQSHPAVIVDWAELADKTDDGIRRPGRNIEQGQRQND